MDILKEKLAANEELLSANPFKQLVDQLQEEIKENDKQKEAALEELAKLKEKLEQEAESKSVDASKADYNVNMLCRSLEVCGFLPKR